MKIELFIEHDINLKIHSEITKLRNECFPDNQANRSYYKQLPHFRYLVFDNNQLIGQMGIDHRSIRVGDEIFIIFGVIDLCINKLFRSKGISSKMLEKLANLAKLKEIDFLFLFADNPNLYLKNGFEYISTTINWLKIDEHKNYGIGLEQFDNEVMIKQVGSKKWVTGEIDLLGYLF